MTFIGHDNWVNRFPILETETRLPKEMDKDVKVLRNCMFFHAEQTTKLSRIKAHFSEFAMQKLINDKFIKIL